MAILQFKRGSTASLQNITPAAGEPVWNKENQRLKIGDGINPYKDLPYINEVDGTSVTINDRHQISLFNYEFAEPGTAPVVSDLRVLSWKKVLTEGDVETIVAQVKDELAEEFAELTGKIETLDDRVDNIFENVIPPINEELIDLQNQVTKNHTDIDDIKTELAELDPQRIEEALETVEQYEDRIDDLEADVGDHERRIQELERDKISPDDIFIIYGGSADEVIIDAHNYEGGD